MPKLAKQYTGPGRVVHKTYLSTAVEDPSGHIHVFFNGTHPFSAHEWAEDAQAAAGQRIPAWDDELQWYIDNYGYESKDVSYTGFSRGGGLAQFLGGTGYGSGHFHLYPPREGSVNEQSGYEGGLWSKMNASIHNAVIEPVSADIDNFDGIVDHITGFDPSTGAPEKVTGASSTRPSHPMATLSSANADRGGHHRGFGRPSSVTPISDTEMHDSPFGTPAKGTKRKADQISPDIPRPTGDFAGLVTTFLNPLTGRIIGYKGIPRRKRRFSTLEHYSEFWKEQNHVTPRTILINPSQA